MATSKELSSTDPNMADECLSCGETDDIEWYGTELHDDQVSCAYYCNKCGFEGEMWYSLRFEESNGTLWES